MQHQHTDPFLNHIRSLPSTIAYTSDTSYRQCVRNIFRFAPDKQTF